jgi:hypothetical protein
MIKSLKGSHFKAITDEIFSLQQHAGYGDGTQIMCSPKT